MTTTDDLNMLGSDPRHDLDQVLRHFPFAGVLELQAALDQDRLVKQQYTNRTGKGCVLYWLSGGTITTKAELLKFDFGAVETQLAARRVVRHFDAHRLDALLPELLRVEIARRQDGYTRPSDNPAEPNADAPTALAV